MDDFGEFSGLVGDLQQQRADASKDDLFAFKPAASETVTPVATPAAPSAFAPSRDFGEFASVADEAAKAENEKVTTALDLARTSDPETYAKARSLADRHGLPVDMALDNLPDLQRRSELVEVRKVLDASPKLKEWFAQADNPRLVKFDDLKAASGLPWLFQASGAAFMAGVDQNNLGSLRWREIVGDASPADILAADKLSGADHRDYAADGWFQEGVVGAAEQAPNFLLAGVEGGKRAVQGMLVGAIGGGATGGPAGAAAAAGTLGTAGLALGAYEYTMRQEAGLAYDEFKKFKDTSTGKNLDPAVAKTAAMLVGIANGALETTSAAFIASKLPGLDKVLPGGMLKTFTRAGMREALTKPSVVAALKAFSTHAAQSAAMEVGTEVAQEFVTIMSGEIAKKLDSGTFQAVSSSDAIDRLLDTAVQTAKVMTIMGPLSASPRLAQDWSRARAAERNVDVFKAMDESASGFTLRERLPDKARELVEAMTAGGPVEAVYVPTAALAEHFQKLELTPQDLDRRMPGFAERLAEATATGPDIAIPIADYYTHVAGTPLGSALVKDIRFHPDQMTANEAQQFNEEWRERLDTMRAEEGEALKAASAAAGPRERIAEAVKVQSMNVGTAPSEAALHGALHGAFFSTMAERAGLDAEQLFKSTGLEIRRELPEDVPYRKTDQFDLVLDRIRSGRADRQVKNAVATALGPSLFTFLRAKGGLEEFRGELNALDVPASLTRVKRDGLFKPAMKLDDAALSAWEAGYFPDRTERPSVAEFLDYLDRENRGEPVYVNGLSTDNMDLSPEDSELRTTMQSLDEYGLDTSSMTNEEIRAEIALIAGNIGSEGGEELFQPAWHGSPHKFEKFSLDHIGKGEGAQAYGWGLYFASRKAIAEWYRNTLAKSIPAHATFDGVRIMKNDLAEITNKIGLGLSYEAISFLKRDAVASAVRNGNADKFSALIDEKIERHLSEAKSFNERADEYERKPPVASTYTAAQLRDRAAIAADHAAGISALKERIKFVEAEKQGRMFKVELPDSGYLDYDKPVFEQSPEVVAALASHGIVAPDAVAPMVDTDLQDIVDAAIRQQGNLDIRMIEAVIDNDQDLYRATKRHAEKNGVEIDEDTTAGEYIVKHVANDYLNALKARSAMVGHDAYRALSKKLGGDKAASMALHDAGINGIKYLDNAARSQHGDTHNYVIFNDEAINVVEYFQTNDLAGPKPDRKTANRGSIRFGDGRTIISLFEQADPSTFLHETGHFFLEVFKDVASRPESGEQIQADWRALQAYLGIGEDGVISTASHEKFARTVEAYLYEGKAPSADLQSAFARFAAWLKLVYRSVTRLGVEINDDVRGIMNRMLASDVAIEQARQSEEFKTWFADAEQAGMTEADFKTYREIAQRSFDNAKADLTSRLLADVKRETTRDWREKKAVVRQEVMDEFADMPVYQATHFLRTGEIIGEIPVAAPPHMRLDRDALVLMFGSEVLRRLPKTVPPLYAKKGGVHPDVIAEVFGFRSGEAMINEMMSAPSMPRAVTAEVAKRMAERFGDLASDQAQLAQEAVERLHNDERGQLLELEMKSLAKRGGLREPYVPRQAAASMARAIISAKTVTDGTRTAVYTAAERRNAKDAERAMLAGDWTAAAEEKRKQMFNHYLALEARKAKEAVDKAVDYISSFTGRKPPPRVSPEYVEQIQGLIDRFDFKAISNPALARRKALAEFVREAEERGEVVAIPEPLLNDAFRQSYKDMTVEDLLAVRDAVKNLDHLGTLKKKLRDGRAQRDFEAVKRELLTTAGKMPRKGGLKFRNPDRLERMREGARGLVGNLLRVEQLVEWLDQRDINGPWRRLLWQRIADAQTREMDLQGKYTVEIQNIFASFPKGYLVERVDISEIGASFTREELLTFALNTGSASNMDKLLRGEAMLTSDRIKVDTREKLDAALSRLSADDWAAVVKIRATIGSLWTEIAAVQKRTTGLEPERVEPQTYQSTHGPIVGGYYPAVYDPRYAFDVAQRAEAKADSLFENTYTRPTTDKGFTKTRVQAYARPMSTSLNVIGDHVAKVIHDVTHREALRDAYKILADADIRTALEGAFGRPVYSETLKWLKRIANDREVTNDATSWQGAVMKLRSNMGIFAMGYRASTVIAQFVGLSNSLEFVRPAYMAASLAEFMRDAHGNALHGGTMPGMSGPFHGDLTAYVIGKSGEMRHRLQSVERDVQDGFRELRGDNSLVANVKRTAFYGVGMADRIVTVPTWHAAYTQHLAEHPDDEAGAIAYGDRAVRLTQGAGAAKDISSIMSKRGVMSWLTMFYSYFNVYFNRMWSLGRDAGVAIQERDASAIPSLAARALVLSILPAVMADLITGKGPDADKDEKWLSWISRKVALYPLQSVPGLRDIGNALDNGFGYQVTPLGRIGKLIVDMTKGFLTGEDINKRVQTKRALELAGTAAGLPIGQAVTTGNNIWQGMENGDFKFRDLIFSKAK